jgi:hypothetical protein
MWPTFSGFEYYYGFIGVRPPQINTDLQVLGLRQALESAKLSARR